MIPCSFLIIREIPSRFAPGKRGADGVAGQPLEQDGLMLPQPLPDLGEFPTFKIQGKQNTMVDK
jgi:hypothetical protein